MWVCIFRCWFYKEAYEKHKCHQCNYTSLCIKKHKNTHRIKETNKCNFCEYASSSAGLIRRHITKKCNECNFVSSSLNESSSLKEHKKIHWEKMHKCNECDFAAFKKFNLKGHKKRHIGIFPFKCTQCDYASNTQTDIVMRKHSGERPFKCTLCSFASSVVHGGEKYLKRKVSQMFPMSVCISR